MRLISDGQLLQRLALLTDARVQVVVMPGGHRRHRALIVILGDRMVEAERYGGAADAVLAIKVAADLRMSCGVNSAIGTWSTTSLRAISES
jgi:hypothetical protein